MNDEEPEVRCAAIKRLGDFGILLEKEFLVDKVVPNFKALSTDSFPYVRQALSESLFNLCGRLGKDGTIEHIVPIY